MTREDPYPSRTRHDPGVLSRKEPVVHAAGEAREKGPLQPDQLLAYEELGFLAFGALLALEELEILDAATQRLLRDSRSSSSPRVVREPGSEEIRSIFAVHEHESAFAAVARNPRLLAVAHQLLGGPVYVHQSRINVKPAFRGEPFHWHSDFETWHVEDGMPSMRALSISISLTHNLRDSGPMMLIPGSHLSFVQCQGETPEAHYERSLKRQEAGIPPERVVAELAESNGIEVPTGPPGSAVVFDCNLLHGSNGNITPFARTNLFLVYNSVDNALEAPFSGQPPRPRHIASRDAQPLP